MWHKKTPSNQRDSKVLHELKMVQVREKYGKMSKVFKQMSVCDLDFYWELELIFLRGRNEEKQIK